VLAGVKKPASMFLIPSQTPIHKSSPASSHVMMTSHHISPYLLIEGINKCITVDTKRSMSESHALTECHGESGLYEIRLKGHLDERWAEWFEGMTITLEEDSNTLLTGPVVDQAALHGLLKKVRDLGMPLVSVNCVDPGRAKTQEVKS
jgi:hypothetical protein